MISNSDMKPERRRSVLINPELVDSFNQHFAVISADTPALQEQAYRLRYQVYCIENSFENPDDHPLKQEMDEYDARSVHSIIIDRPSQMITGTARIILPDQDAVENSFPIQKVCGHPLLHNHKILHMSRAAEISRFAVSKEFSRRVGDLHPSRRQTDFRNERRTATPNITLGLINGIVRMSMEHGVLEWFAVMEPTLLRLLARFGIYFSPIGPMVNYHGMRQPCHANIAHLLNRVRKDRIDVWETITDHGMLLDRENHSFAPFRLIN